MTRPGETVRHSRLPAATRRARVLAAGCLALALVGSSLALDAGQAPAQQPPAAPTSPPPEGNLNELMRAIFFPNANVIFNVQLEDPSAERPPAPKGGGGAGSFSITSWGSNLYTPWESVSYAAVALEESSLLLMKAGRQCQNGRPVPVGEADWARFTEEVVATGKAVYAAAQMKDRDKVTELTERLNDSCQSCHSVYRRGGDATRCVVPAR
jgi:hypothetical protein